MKIEKGIRNEPQTIMIYGQEGVGKSTLFASEPAIYADCENGTTRLDVDRVNCTSYQDVRYLLNHLKADKTHFYQWFVLDTWTSFERLLVNHICQENNWQNLETPGYGKGYKVLHEEAEAFIRRLKVFSKQTGMNVAILAHAHATRFDDPLSGTSYDRYEVAARATGKTNIAEMLKKEVAAIGFLHYERTIIREEGERKAKAVGAQKTSKVLIGTRNCAAYDAKNRHGMPSILDIPEAAPFDAIREYLKAPEGAVKDEAPEEATTEQPEEIAAPQDESKGNTGRTISDLKITFINLAKATFGVDYVDECKDVLQGRKFDALPILDAEDAVEEMRSRCVDAENHRS